MTTLRSTICIALFLGLSAAWAMAATEAELKDRFEQRFTQLRQYKDDGKVGETTAGLVEAVKSEYLKDEALKQLIAVENADRQELYQIVAAKTGATADVVARRNAKRNFDKAKPGDWLKGDNGVWKQK